MDILFENHNGIGKITLNRPQALNALSGEMFVALDKQLKQWIQDDAVKAVLVRSVSEKAFCAGGDIRSIYDNKSQPPEIIARYFRLEFDVDKLIFHYPKPYIALINGITMGGGVGISLYGSHRVATENLRWAMPETLIGYFPDVAASYYLSRLPQHIGTYLALTGEMINAEDALHLKFIDAIISNDALNMLEVALLEASPDSSSITAVIDSFKIAPKTHQLSLPSDVINRCFAFNTIEKIVDALKNEKTAWANHVLSLLQKRSPTSLKVTLRQLQYAKQKTFDEVIEMDFNLSLKMLGNHDFFEGIRAAIVDKDKNPQWSPAELSKITDNVVEGYFEETL